MSRSIPLFKSHYSLGRSSLTLEKAGASSPSEPDSIIDLALNNKLNRVFLVEDGMSSFLEAYSHCKAAKLSLSYGVRVSCCSDLLEKSEESLKKTCKLVIMIRNTQGYRRMVKIFTSACLKGFYYEPRVDFQLLKQHWSEDDLQMCIPFYDSFLYCNLFTFATCVPDFSFAKPVFFIEDNELWIDEHLRNKVEEYCKANKFETLNTQSVYYNRREDFKTYLTFRCINKRTALEKPEIEHMTSDSFCLDNWKERNGVSIQKTT
jgi:DNA polymerase III subunit alpha